MSFLKNFLTNTSGNVAMMFAVGSLAVLASVGLAIDYAGLQDGHAELQSQVDAAVLAVAKSGLTDLDDMNALALASMIENGFDPNFPAPVVTFDTDGRVQVAAAAEYDVMIMGMFGSSTKNLGAMAESQIGGGRQLELALVVDTTESMAGAKMTALITAANELVDDFAATESNEVKISLVPFSAYVNVDSDGMDNRNASWIDVPDDYSEDQTYTPRRRVAAGYCQVPEVSVPSMADGVWGTRMECPSGSYVYPEYEWDDPTTRTNNYVWNGCVVSRKNGLHLQDYSYASKIPGRLNISCADSIVPLTTDYAALKTAITNLDDGGSTYMPAGLIWGQRVLSPGVPYDQGSADPDTQKHLVLMTDGMNTVRITPDGESHGTLDMSIPTQAAEVVQTNLDTASLCTRIKSSGIQIYTIAFEVPDVNTKNMLRACASGSQNYFSAESSQQLLSAFKSITGSITSVRLTK